MVSDFNQTISTRLGKSPNRLQSEFADRADNIMQCRRMGVKDGESVRTIDR